MERGRQCGIAVQRTATKTAKPTAVMNVFVFSLMVTPRHDACVFTR